MSDHETPETPAEAPNPGESPSMVAVRMAMQAAAEAAEARAKAKAAARASAAGELTPDDEDWEVIAATAVDRWAFEHGADAREETTLDLDGGDAAPDDVDALVRAIERDLPDAPGEEVHGDLVIKRQEDQAKAWYELAATEALPEPLRDVAGPLDVKRLLTALLVEVGDVKRTNAMLMEQLARIEEKVERTNRHLRGHKTY